MTQNIQSVQTEHGPELADLMAIWPIAASLAVHTPVGDLINLSRSSTVLRSALHGQELPLQTSRHAVAPVGDNLLRPPVGWHQTVDWAHLKSIARFSCSSTTHTRGQVTRPCRYCSRPICDACIVRDSFKNPNEKTFQNRLRYFCKECWSEGRPTRSFKYPILHAHENTRPLGKPSHEAGEEMEPVNTDDYCACNLKDNGWLCLECKNEQNTSSSSMLTKPPEVRSIQCHGLDCTNYIDGEASDKDRRRVCLWCQRPLRRQWGGEDRYTWNLKTWAIRSANAESRSRDIEEYNRRRLKTLRMSRREMRGTSGPNDDTPSFVRHLDTVNYRIWLPENYIPDPEAVYKSKNGHWIYHRSFLVAIQQRCRKINFTSINGVNVSDMSAMTQNVSLIQARLNKNMPSWHFGPWAQWRYDGEDKRFRQRCLEELRVRILDLYLAQSQDTTSIANVLEEQYGISIGRSKLQRMITQWLEKQTRTSRTCDSLDMDEAKSPRRDGTEEETKGRTEKEHEDDDDDDDEDNDDDNDEIEDEDDNEDEVEEEEEGERTAATHEAEEGSEPEQMTEPPRLIMTTEPLAQTDLPEGSFFINSPPDFTPDPVTLTADQHEDDPPPYNS